MSSNKSLLTSSSNKKAALAHFPIGQSATFYTHRTGENMRTASRSSNSRWTHPHIKRPTRLQPGKPSEDLPYGQSGIRRLPGCIRCTPASSQSSSIHNSLRSIKQTAVWRLSSFSPGKFCELRDFAYGQNLCVLYAKFPPPKAKRLQLVYAPQSPQGKKDRLRYRSAEWTVSTPWPERFQLRWHLRLRLGNVSKLPFLSACT